MSMKQETEVLSGGILTVQSVPSTQVVYLDFDGELTSYNGEILTLDSVTVEDSGLTAERITAITDMLNQQFRDRNVVFVTEKPASGDYSTVYVGKTSSFEPYGNFAGLAETVDSGNKNKNDKAFVILDSTSDNNRIVETIAHETGHLTGTLDHGGTGLQKYATEYVYATYWSSTGFWIGEDTVLIVDYYCKANDALISYGGRMVVCQNAMANGTYVDHEGQMTVGGPLEPGVANNTTVCGTMYVDGIANSTSICKGGSMYVCSGAMANGIDFNYGGSVFISSGGSADDVVINGTGSMFVSKGGSANRITVSGSGCLNVYDGGAVNSTTVSGGTVTVCGTAENTVVSGGSMLVSSGGVVKGKLRIENGAVVSACGGVGIDFTVAEQTDSSTALISDWSLISGGADAIYTLTVSATQGTGDYLLAGGAADFNQVISVRNTEGDAITDLTVGNSFKDNGKTYTLTKDEGNLALNISLETVENPSYTTETAAGGGISTRIENATAAKAYIGGQLLADDADVEGSYVVEVDGGSFEKTIAGGDAVKTESNIYRTGNIGLTIEDGTFDQRVAGGLYYCPATGGKDGSVTLEGNIDLVVKGGTFNGRIYGGCNAKTDELGENTTIIGNVNLTVDVSSGVNIGNHLVAGSRGTGNIDGDVIVAFTGDAGSGSDCTLKFADDSVVYGGCSGDYSYAEVTKTSTSKGTNSAVTGDRRLVFTAFTGDFDAQIMLFKTVSFESNSQVNFTDEKLNTWAVKEWNFEYGCDITGFRKNEFEGDTLNFDFGTWDGTMEWSVLTGTTAGLSDLVLASAVNFGGNAAHLELDYWTDGVYKLSVSTIDSTRSELVITKSSDFWM